MIATAKACISLFTTSRIMNCLQVWQLWWKESVPTMKIAYFGQRLRGGLELESRQGSMIAQTSGCCFGCSALHVKNHSR